MVSWEDFEKCGIRVGTIVKVEDFPDAHKPTYKLLIDLGEFGIKKSSARIVELYDEKELIGKQVICVTGFQPKKIGPFISEVLTTGFYTDNGVVLAQPERKVQNGLKLL